MPAWGGGGEIDCDFVLPLAQRSTNMMSALVYLGDIGLGLAKTSACIELYRATNATVAYE